MKEYYKGEVQLAFDDILLVPKGGVQSRRDVDLKMYLGGLGLELPIISSPMDTITGSRMAEKLGHAGGLGIIHRYMTIDEQKTQVRKSTYITSNVGAAVGATGDFLERAVAAINVGARVICIDTANGHGEAAVSATQLLREKLPNIHIMVGNVSTAWAYKELSEAGADSVRIGIGGGSMCTTRLVSGHGMPTLASIMDCADYRESGGASIIADGGIRNTGDMAKAFAAGADAVMLGSMLAGTDETPGDIRNGYKVFRGMASKDAQIDWHGSYSGEEGISTKVKYRGPVQRVFEEIKMGLGSACSYSGVDHLKDLHDQSEYIRVTPTTLAESRPHGG